MLHFDDPQVNKLLADLPGRVHAVLGPKLVGLYLYGSLVTGDYDPGISDVDLLAVLAGTLTGPEFDALDAMHREIIGVQPAWLDRLEIAYLSAAALQTFRDAASPLGIISPGEPFNIKDAGIEWLMNWYLVRETGRTLYGPPPAQLIGPIAQAEFLQAVRDHALSWGGWIEQTSGSAKSQSYAVLTLCRTCYTIEHGEHVSKRRAAGWAAAVWPHWAALVRRALAWREIEHVTVDPQTTFLETKAFVQFVVTWLEQESVE